MAPGIHMEPAALSSKCKSFWIMHANPLKGNHTVLELCRYRQASQRCMPLQ